MRNYFTWPSRNDGGDGHKHVADASERRTLCGQIIGDWIRGDLESPGERCPRCDAAGENQGKRTAEQAAPAAMMLTTRSALKRAMAKADWELTAFYAAETDAEVTVAAAKVRRTAAEVDALYREFAGMLASAAEVAA